MVGSPPSSEKQGVRKKSIVVDGAAKRRMVQGWVLVMEGEKQPPGLDEELNNRV